jgi:uncharacterized protein YndB with AHSA1/START domain
MPETAVAREISITRIFDAPRDLVWRAWTVPGRLAAWWGPHGWSTDARSVVMDVTPGGAFRVTSVHEDGREMTVEGTYREVIPPERLVLEEPPDSWHDGAVTEVTFTELGDGRTAMAFRSAIHTSEAGRDAAAGGLDSAFDRLAASLESR